MYVAEENRVSLVLLETSTGLVGSRPIFELVPSIRYKLACAYSKDSKQSVHLCSMVIGVAPIAKLCMCIIKIVTFKGNHLMW